MSGQVFVMETTHKGKERLKLFEDLFTSEKMLSMTGSELLSLASKFNKVEKTFYEKHSGTLVKKKIGILGSFTTHHYVGIFKLFLYRYGIAPVFYEGEYDAITAELMDPNSQIFSFQPEILLILTHHNDIKDYPELFASEEEIHRWIGAKVQHYQGIWKNAAKIKGCHIFQTLFILPLYRQLGNLEGNYPFSASSCLRALNIELIRQKPPYVTYIDMDYLASAFGKYRWFDDVNYFMSKQGFSFDAASLVAHTISRLIASQAGKAKKCLVLDLDNTLWGGVIGDDGLEGINMSPNDALGEAYIAFQKYIKTLKERGVIVAVCSKNDEEIARTPFEQHPDMILKIDDVACFMANWNDKASNLREIANRLNIGLDSLVFFDDNPAEREIIRQVLPEVEIVEVPEDPALFVRALERSCSFEWVQLSKEDMRRSDSYIMDKKRQELAVSCADYDSYLKSLEMKGEISLISSMESPRFTQLINKSNQFNLRTKRYTEAAVEQMREDPEEWFPLSISLADKFGSYGIISSIIIQKIEDIAFIDTWVMSCRVLKRRVENAALNAIGAAAKSWASEWMVGEYIPTKKNSLVKNLYLELGFERSNNGWFALAHPDGIVYRLKVSDFVDRPHQIELKKRMR